MHSEVSRVCPLCGSTLNAGRNCDTCSRIGIILFTLLWTAPTARIDLAAFLAAVSDPLNPTCCSFCFCILVRIIRNSQNRLCFLRERSHEIWERCIILLVVYAESDVSRLREVLKQNQLRCSRRAAQHKKCHVGDKKLDDPFHAFIDALCELISTGMTKGKNAIVCAERSKQSFRRRRGVWPTTPESLFPLGVARTVDALVHWCCAPMSSAPFVLLKTYLMAARVLVMPLLLQSPRRERLLWALLQAMTCSVCVPWSDEPPFMMPKGLSVPRSLRGGAALVEHAMALLHTVRADYGAHPSDAARFVAGYGATLLRELEGLPVASGVTSESKLDATALEIVSFKNLLNTHLARNSDPVPVGMASRIEIVYNFLKKLRAARTCVGPGCCSTELSMSRFSCELCCVVYYCSHDCQRADWKHGVPRHKDVCPLVSSLLQRGAKLDDPDEAAFSAAIEEMGYDFKDMNILYEWATGSGVRT